MNNSGDAWGRLNKASFWVTIAFTFAAFLVALPLEWYFGFGHVLQVVIWLRILATVALLSTVVWSVIGFLSLYFGPHEVWERQRLIGKWSFSGASACCLAAVVFCLGGLFCVWGHLTHGHLWAATVAEGFFWSFDSILLRSLLRSGEAGNLSTEERVWILSVSKTLAGWIGFVARPATISLACLSLGVYFLEMTGILVGHLEVEIFATGALFLALMTANLAFYAVNK